MDCKKKLMLGLLWSIILKYQLEGALSEGAKTVKAGLLCWAQRSRSCLCMTQHVPSDVLDTRFLLGIVDIHYVGLSKSPEQGACCVHCQDSRMCMFLL